MKKQTSLNKSKKEILGVKTDTISQEELQDFHALTSGRQIPINQGLPMLARLMEKAMRKEMTQAPLPLDKFQELNNQIFTEKSNELNQPEIISESIRFSPVEQIIVRVKKQGHNHGRPETNN